MGEKLYQVKPECYEKWGWFGNDDCITMQDIETLSREWEVPIDELLKQVTEC